MRRRKNNKFNNIANKRPFIIHGVTEIYDDNPLVAGWVNYHTHGLSDHGLTELSIVCPDINDTRPCELINIVGDMMLNGETFEFGCVHCLDDDNGITIHKFMLKPTTCFEETSIRIIIPDKDTNMFIKESLYNLQNLDVFTDYENISLS